MYCYAQLSEENICVGVSQLSGEVIADNMIPLEFYDSSLIGKRYQNGLWEDIPVEEMPEPEPTEQELITAEVLLGQAEILTNQEKIDKTLAEILLNQVGG